MRIDQILDERRPVFSFEFYPPKDEPGELALAAALTDLVDDQPDFVSITYGAAGSTRDGTVEWTTRIKREYGLEAMAHLSCVGTTVDELREILSEIGQAGIENVLALRGDPPRGQKDFEATEGGLTSSDQLAALIRKEFGYTVGATCFPEKHPDAIDAEADIAFARKKVEAGASFLISQLFFENDLFFDFVERAREAGITVPIMAGIMPVQSYGQIKRITDLCDASIPDTLDRELAERDGDSEAVATMGIAYATLQCADLLARGAQGIHFYTLNKSPATRAILAALRAARPWDRVEEPV
ncbi:MAG: methylenetetrahydrofolate reductase [Thermoleophilaceae bacterium]|jgi:methylenetetrahydrofolate reductase (NADPH)|nr:methylenetetrahydrofolate reductase [Thermoleophilaceae bacterium]